MLAKLLLEVCINLFEPRTIFNHRERIYNFSEIKQQRVNVFTYYIVSSTK